MSTRAVFLDKDGTIIENVPYNVDPALIRVTAGAAEGLPTLIALGYRLVVVSNQSGVARGYFREEALAPVEDRLRRMLADLGAPLAGFYYCPHHPDGSAPGYAVSCSCRKPAAGLIHRASRDLGVDPERSWFIGDSLDDVEAGRRAGCRTVLIADRPPTDGPFDPARIPHHVAPDLAEAARIIEAAEAPN